MILFSYLKNTCFCSGILNWNFSLWLSFCFCFFGESPDVVKLRKTSIFHWKTDLQWKKIQILLKNSTKPQIPANIKPTSEKFQSIKIYSSYSRSGFLCPYPWIRLSRINHPKFNIYNTTLNRKSWPLKIYVKNCTECVECIVTFNGYNKCMKPSSPKQEGRGWQGWKSYCPNF